MCASPDGDTATVHQLSAAKWDERALLLLGVLMDESQHGYQINEFIERHLAHIYPMKKPTAYAVLDRLEAAGAIAVRIEQAGNRPPRKVYTLTDAGRTLFHALLERNLRTFDDPAETGDIGLIFSSHLDTQVVVDALRSRLNGIECALNELETTTQSVAPHHAHLRLDLANEHAQILRIAEQQWLQRTIDRLREGSS